MQVVVDNLMTHYELQGKGKLVLLLHGWGDNSQGSLVLQRKLAEKYTVLAPDLPGFGKTQLPPTAWGLDEYAAFVAALLRKLDVGTPYAVIGHSNGGAIAARAVAQQVIAPEKIILLAAAGIRKRNTGRKLLLKFIAKTGDIATIGLPERYRQNLRKQLYASAGSEMLVVAGMERTFQKIVTDDVQADIPKIQQPTLLIFGQNDRAVPPYMGNRYAELLSSAQLHLLDAGHFVHLDKPQEVNRLIGDFLK